MFRKIASVINYPKLWAGTVERPSRYRCLDQLDRMLDGSFYDHLNYGFYDEMRPGGSDIIPLHERRPSSQYHLPRMVARWSSRKLWAGRHTPRIHHSSKSVSKLLDQLIQTTKFHNLMMNATLLGSVGAVAITFRVERVDNEPLVGLKIWRARQCTPTFDDFDNLVNLRVYYNVRGVELLRRSIERDATAQPIKPDQEYWWIRDYGTQSEITYVPPSVDDWNPVMGWHKPDRGPVILSEVPHSLGFVPGVWIKNLTGCTGYDGVGTWDDAKDISIEIDYLLSQASRGTRYNCAPELVVVGEFEAGGSPDTRSPSSYIHLKAGVKQESGESFGEGKASLLEMSGNGIKAAHELIDKLRNMALEQIGATRKDPEKLKGVMSGRAMEFLDEDSHDLVMELRGSYGDGALELMRKIVRAIGGPTDPKGLMLDWPRLYQPTPEDLAHIIPALVQAATPIQDVPTPEDAKAFADAVPQPAPSATPEAGKTSGTKGGRPSGGKSGGLVGKSLGSLLDVKQVAEFLKIYMDIDLLPDADKSGVSDSDVPTSEPRPPEQGWYGPEEEDDAGKSGLNPMDEGMSV